MGNVWMLMAILLPVVAGVVLPLIKRCAQRKARRIYVGGVLAVCFATVVCSVASGSGKLLLWHMTDTISIYFRMDEITMIFAPLMSGMWLIVGIYAFDYMCHEQNETRFFTFYLIALGMLLGLSFAGNLVTMYMCFELMTLASAMLVVHTMTKEAIRAALKYLFYSIAGALMALLGIFFLSNYAVAQNFQAGGVLDFARIAGQENTLLAILMVTLVGFGTKAGMFPMHGWLPTAHPIAPAPASAVLSGVITKSGVLCIIRVVFYVVGVDFLRGTWVQYVWLTLALVTVFMGSMMAYKEPVLKKRLAYSSVSQISYILAGLALLDADGFLGGLLHVIFHSLIKDGLFMVAGAIIVKTGVTRVEELSGIGKRMPVTMWCYAFLSLALIGIPPTAGFVSKWYLASGALASGLGAFTYVMPIVLLVSALLTAGYLLPLAIRGFFPGQDMNPAMAKRDEASPWMLVPILIVTALAVGLGMFPAPLMAFIRSVAAAIL